MGNWQLDPYHTQIEFSAKHLGMMTVRGYFDEVSAVADIDPDHPEAASVEVTISTASIRTNNATRDNDIRSSNFLEVDKYPVITFKSTSVEPAGADRYTLTGDLTIKGTTHSVALDVTKYGEFNDAGMMGHRIAYGATTKDQPEGLRAEVQRGPGRQARRQRGHPDHDRGRARRAAGGGRDRRLTATGRCVRRSAPQQVDVTRVAGILLDRSDQHLAQRHRPATAAVLVQRVVGGQVETRRVGHEPGRELDLRTPRLPRQRDHVGIGDGTGEVAVTVGLRGEQARHVLAGPGRPRARYHVPTCPRRRSATCPPARGADRPS